MNYNEQMNFVMTEDERRFLLTAARETITARLEKRDPVYPCIVRGNDSPLLKPCGAFVTLHKGKDLRGCIGRMSAVLPLEETIKQMAVQAAFGDPRFPPLGKDELLSISIEISALSPMEICLDPRSIKIGVHGLFLVYRGRSGVLLPQVPVEQGWNLDEYLEYICIKAGVPPESYKNTEASLSVFTALVFGE